MALREQDRILYAELMDEYLAKIPFYNKEHFPIICKILHSIVVSAEPSDTDRFEIYKIGGDLRRAINNICDLMETPKNYVRDDKDYAEYRAILKYRIKQKINELAHINNKGMEKYIFETNERRAAIDITRLCTSLPLSIKVFEALDVVVRLGLIDASNLIFRYPHMYTENSFKKNLFRAITVGSYKETIFNVAALKFFLTSLSNKDTFEYLRMLDTGRSIFRRLAERNKTQTLELLFKKLVNPDFIYYLIESGVLQDRAATDITMLKFLINYLPDYRQANALLATDEDGDNLLHRFRDMDTLKLLLSILVKEKSIHFIFTHKNRRGETMLHQAARLDNREIVTYLLGQISDNKKLDYIFDENTHNENMLTVACYREDEVKSIQAILDTLPRDKKAAAICKQDSLGRTILHLLYHPLVLTNNLSKVKTICACLTEEELSTAIKKTQKDGEHLLHYALKEKDGKIYFADVAWVLKAYPKNERLFALKDACNFTNAAYKKYRANYMFPPKLIDIASMIATMQDMGVLAQEKEFANANVMQA